MAQVTQEKVMAFYGEKCLECKLLEDQLFRTRNANAMMADELRKLKGEAKLDAADESESDVEAIAE